MKAYNLYLKLRERWVRFHTSMISKTLGSYGGECRIESPVNFGNPGRIHVGRGSIICAGALFSCVTEWEGYSGYDGEIHIGEYTEIRENVQISAATKLIIGNYCGISRNCLIADHTHSHELVDSVTLRHNPLTKPRPVVIEDNCYIGAGVMISPGVRIGKYSVVGYGSLVSKSVPPYSVVIGSPARMISRYDHEAGRWVICRRKL